MYISNVEFMCYNWHNMQMYVEVVHLIFIFIIFIFIFAFIYIVISTFTICISIFIFIHVYTVTNIHTWSYRIIHIYMYIYINILRETHIYLATNACYTVSSNENLEKISGTQVRSCIGWSEEGELFGRAASDLWGTRRHSGWEKSSKCTLINHQLVTTRINCGPLKNGQACFKWWNGKKNPEPFGGISGFEFWNLSFQFFFGGFWFFWFQDLLSFLGGGGFWETWGLG